LRSVHATGKGNPRKYIKINNINLLIKITAARMVGGYFHC
jgi:hypothetical protein